MVSTITNCLWYLDPFLERLEARSITVPKLFKGLTGYRELKKQKKKIPQVITWKHMLLFMLLGNPERGI